MVKKSTDLVRVAEGVHIPRWQAEQHKMSYTERLTLVPELGAKRHASFLRDKKVLLVACSASGVVGAILGSFVTLFWMGRKMRQML